MYDLCHPPLISVALPHARPTVIITPILPLMTSIFLAPLTLSDATLFSSNVIGWPTNPVCVRLNSLPRIPVSVYKYFCCLSLAELLRVEPRVAQGQYSRWVGMAFPTSVRLVCSRTYRTPARGLRERPGPTWRRVQGSHFVCSVSQVLS